MPRLFTLLLLLAASTGASAQIIAIRAGLLIDPETGTARPDQVILVEGRTIRAVGPDLAVPAGARVVDLSDAVVMPGLIDAHTHLCLTMPTVEPDAAMGLDDALLLTAEFTSTGYRALQGVANGRAMLAAGFTTVRDVGNAANYADTDLRRAIENGLVEGPTVINAGRIIAPLGGQYRGVLTPERPTGGQPEYLFADSRDELRRAVRENILYGARVIKIVIDDQPFTYSADDVRFVVEEAGRAGLRVAAHAATEAGAIAAIDGGVASIEHGFHLSDATIARARAAGVVLVGTDFTAEISRAYGSGPEEHTLIVDRLRRAYRGGMQIAFGSDVVIDLPGYTRGTLALSMTSTFVEAGIPPADLLRMLTTNGARLLGVEEERGAIRPGMAADLIAMPANPLDGVDALQGVFFVMKDGAVFRHDGE